MVFNKDWQTEVTQLLEYYLESGSKRTAVFQSPVLLKYLYVMRHPEYKPRPLTYYANVEALIKQIFKFDYSLQGRF